MSSPLDASQVNNYDLGMGIVNEFTFVPGTCVLPIAEEPPTSDGELATWSPVVVLQLHAPYRLRRTNYSAQKCNNPPVMPTPQTAGAFVFLDGRCVVGNNLNQSYVSFDWSMSADYTFVENCVSRPQDGLVLGTPPWQWQTTDFNVASHQASNTQIGAVATAGQEVKVAATMGNSIVFDGNSQSSNGYLYNMPSLYPGTFFNDTLVNGGGTS